MNMSDEEFEAHKKAEGIKNEKLAKAVMDLANNMPKDEFNKLIVRGLKLNDLEKAARDYIAKKNFKGPKKRLDL